MQLLYLEALYLFWECVDKISDQTMIKLYFPPFRVRCLGKSNSTTPRPSWNVKVRIFLLHCMLCFGHNSWLEMYFFPPRQLEALDKELQQLSKIKENVDEKVWKHWASTRFCSWLSPSIYLMTTFLIEFCNYSLTVGIEEEAVPCAAQYHTGASTDTRK